MCDLFDEMPGLVLCGTHTQWLSKFFLLYFHTLRTLKLHCRYGVSSLYHVKFAKICPECTFRLEHMRHDCRHISSYNIMHKRSEVCYITLVLHYKNVFQM